MSFLQRDPESLPPVPPETLPWWKRCLDLGCCVVLLPLLMLLTGVLVVGSLFGTPGPVFFRQEKIGWGGRRIWIYRFRTMRVDSGAMGWPQLRAAEALIFGGGFLRATGLGELPQVLNVLQGEMSIVGPRPVTSKTLESMSPFLERGLNSLPGLTGLSPGVFGKAVRPGDAVELDAQYARAKSLGLDLKLVLLATWVVFRRAIGVGISKLTGEKPADLFSDSALPGDSRRPW